MQSRTLWNIIATALASSTFASGQAACDECTETPYFNVGDLVVAPARPLGSASGDGPVTALVTPLRYDSVADVIEGDDGEAGSPADAAAPHINTSTLREEEGAPVDVADAGTYEEWLAALAAKPCAAICEELIVLAQVADDSVGPVTRCSPPATQGTAFVVHCEWKSSSCIHAPSNNDTNDSNDSGCSLGRGRVPGGFVSKAIAEPDPRARFFASAAQLEAASVTSFAIVVRDLTLHGAPLRLIRAARRARADEVRHTRVMAAFARRYGALAVPRGSAARWRSRPLETIALENMVEGCVRETYGAIDASWMARKARDPRVRAAMRIVARDETRHAALAWQIAEWSSRALGADARERIATARIDAIRQLAAELRSTPSPALEADGLSAPTGVRLALLASLERGLQTHVAALT
jgi:hypothetical protein